MIQECSFGRQEMGGVQMFFLTPNRNVFSGKVLVNLERLLPVLQGHIIFNVKWDEVHKMSEVFWAKLYCKMSNLFWQSLLALRLSAKKSEIKKNSDDVHSKMWTNITKLYARKKRFFSKKKNLNMRFWIIYILVQIFLGDYFRAF